jgi:hypothetical protein
MSGFRFRQSSARQPEQRWGSDDIVNPSPGQEDAASISVLHGTVGICIHIRTSLGDNNADIS